MPGYVECRSREALDRERREVELIGVDFIVSFPDCGMGCDF